MIKSINVPSPLNQPPQEINMLRSPYLNGFNSSCIAVDNKEPTKMPY